MPYDTREHGLFFELLGFRGGIIADNAHPLVVERSIFIFICILARIK